MRHLIVLATLLLAACQQAESPGKVSGATVCEDPRPEMCTREYRPVCALRDTGVRCVTEPCDNTEQKTYGNACDACADPAVISYTEGACEAAAD